MKNISRNLLGLPYGKGSLFGFIGFNHGDLYGSKDIIIQKKELGKDKTLKGNIITKNIEEQLWELKNLK